MPVTNLSIPEELRRELSKLMLQLAQLRRKFKDRSDLAEALKPGYGLRENLQAFENASKRNKVKIAREIARRQSEIESLQDVKDAISVLQEASEAITELMLDRTGAFVSAIDSGKNPYKELTDATNELVAAKRALRKRRRELEAELDTDPPPPPPAEEPDEEPGFLKKLFDDIFGESSPADGAFSARSLAGGPAFERLGGVLELASAAGREFDGAMRDLDETGARVAATFEGEVEGLDALLDGLKQGEGEVDEFGASLTELKDVGRRAFAGLEGALGEFIRTGKFEWRDLAQVALGAIGDIFDAQLKAAGGASSGGGGIGGILSGITGVLGSLLGGASATPFADAAAAAGIFSPFEHGGRFAANQPILVGEAGPELLVPPMAGEIVPNHALAGGAPQQSVNQKFVINISPGVPEAVRAAILQLKPQIQQWAIEGVMAASMRGGAIARMPRV